MNSELEQFARAHPLQRIFTVTALTSLLVLLSPVFLIAVLLLSAIKLSRWIRE